MSYKRQNDAWNGLPYRLEKDGHHKRGYGRKETRTDDSERRLTYLEHFFVLGEQTYKRFGERFKAYYAQNHSNSRYKHSVVHNSLHSREIVPCIIVTYHRHYASLQTEHRDKEEGLQFVVQAQNGHRFVAEFGENRVQNHYVHDVHHLHNDRGQSEFIDVACKIYAEFEFRRFMHALHADDNCG